LNITESSNKRIPTRMSSMEHNTNSFVSTTPNFCQTRGRNSTAFDRGVTETHRGMSTAEEATAETTTTTTTNKSAESLLAHELNKLSFRERESINEEIHGIGVGAAVDDETPERLAESFRRLQSELEGLCRTHGGVGGIASAFQRSQNVVVRGGGATPYAATAETYLNSEELRIMFLRCERFDPKKAALRLCRFADLMHDLYGDTGLERAIKLSDIPDDEVAIMRSGRCQVLGARDQAGRRVYVHFFSEAFSALSIETRLRVVMYYSMTLLYNDISTQRNGVVCLGWLHNVQIKAEYLRTGEKVHGRLSHAMPLRVGAIHYFHPSTDHYDRTVSFALAKIITGLITQYKPHVRVHLGSAMESFYVLESFGISSKQFPVDLSTGKIDLTNNERWLKIRASEERAPKKPRSSSRRRLVECPSQSDVLLGRGKVIMYHPGNIVFRHYIDFKLESYTKLRTKKDSVHWTRGVVQSFQKQYDARFLREERIDGTDFMAWVEVPNDVARNKVRIAFRDARSRLAAAGGRSRGGDTTADSKAAGEDSGSRTPTTTTSSSSSVSAGRTNALEGRTMMCGSPKSFLHGLRFDECDRCL